MNLIHLFSKTHSWLASAKRRLNLSGCLAALVAVLATAIPSDAAAKSYALIVAVRDYPNCQSLPSLVGVNRDAVRLRQVLQTSGFAKQDVEVVYDEAQDAAHKPTRRNILNRLDSLLARTNSGDLVLVVTSSHGLVFDKVSYLCPAETTEQTLGGKAAARQGLIAVGDITERMSKCRAENRLLVVDACRDASRSRTRGFVNLLQKPPQGLWLMNSCSEEQYSFVSDGLEDGEPHAVFSYFLCEGLSGAADMIGNNDGQISLLELYSYAYAKTLEEVLKLGERQNPELFGGMAPPFSVANTNQGAGRRRLASSDPVLTRRQSAESLAHLTRAWCYRASGMYQEALDGFHRAGEHCDLYVKGSPDSLDQYIDRQSGGQPMLAAREGDHPRSPVPVVPLFEKPEAGSPSVANVSAYSKVRVGEVVGDHWLLVTAVNDNPLPKHGWIRRDRVVWFAEASEVYTPASPMLSQGGYGGGVTSLSPLDYAAANLDVSADRLPAPAGQGQGFIRVMQPGEEQLLAVVVGK